jgi:hypothetical protein
MRNDTPDQSPTPATRAEAYRERFRRAQAIAAQVARARAAGGSPGEAEAARLVAEFHARGGRVTVCPPAEDGPAGAGRDGGEPGKRGGA